FYMSSLISHSRPYFVFDSYAAPRHLHSFPTRRSSDLETYKDSNRDFERSLSVQSPFLNGGLFWTGDSTYEKDQMSANHQLHVEADDIGEDMLSIQLAVDGKQEKEIETVEADNVKDIGKMSEAELDAYIEGDAAEQFFAWYMEMFGDVGF